MKDRTTSKVLRSVRTRKGVKKYTYLGCRLTRNRSPWCYRICPPDSEGRGRCGRIAPHSLMGNTQMAILNYKKKKLKEHFTKLESMYLSDSANDLYEPGIRLSEGAADVLIPMKNRLADPAGTVRSSVCYKVMADAATYAVNATVANVVVKPVAFSIYMTEAVPKGMLIARGRFVGSSGDHLMAESLLTDSDGVEIARGSGTFIAGDTELSPKIGYK